MVQVRTSSSAFWKRGFEPPTTTSSQMAKGGFSGCVCVASCRTQATAEGAGGGCSRPCLRVT